MNVGVNMRFSHGLVEPESVYRSFMSQKRDGMITCSPDLIEKPWMSKSTHAGADIDFFCNHLAQRKSKM